MTEPPARQSREKKLGGERPKDQTPPPRNRMPRPPKRPARQETQGIQQADKKEKSGTEVVSESVVEGANGARHIAIEHVNVEVGHDYPSYEIVTTLPEHQLRVEYRQLNWVKTYEGIGRVQTDVCPIAPIGTKLICTAKDLTTGEEVVREYKWHSLGSALMSWLWKWIKRLFVRDAG